MEISNDYGYKGYTLKNNLLVFAFSKTHWSSFQINSNNTACFPVSITWGQNHGLLFCRSRVHYPFQRDCFYSMVIIFFSSRNWLFLFLPQKWKPYELNRFRMVSIFIFSHEDFIQDTVSNTVTSLINWKALSLLPIIPIKYRKSYEI